MLAAVIAFAFTACEKKVDEKAALANFKSEAEAFGKWAEEKGKAASTDPMAGIAMMGELPGKFKAIKTDGLPADLKSAWADMGGILGEMTELFKDVKIPKIEKPEDATKVMAELGPKFQEIGPKLQAIQAKAERIDKKLEEVGKKYNLDMTKVGLGK